MTPDARGHRRGDAAQLAAWARLNAQLRVLARFPGTGQRLLALAAGSASGVRAGGWPPGFVPVAGRAADLMPAATGVAAGRLTLLGETRALERPADWAARDASPLWRQHMHRWEWAWSLAHHRDRAWARERFAALLRSWRAGTSFGRGEAWAPYIASVRAWVLCGLFAPLAAGTDVAVEVRDEQHRHAAFLRYHRETDVGGDHLVKNLTALVGLAVAADDTRSCARWLAFLREETRRQVLADGGHAGRCPAVHCQVLADLTDVADLLSAIRRPVPDWLASAVERMRGWLGEVLLADGTVPAFGDGDPVPPALVAALRPAAASAGSVLLAESGIAVLRAGGWHAVAEVCPAGPRGLPAHAHADTLSFLLWHDGVPVLVDTGAASGANGPRRYRDRATAAHNTVVVDGADSSEVCTPAARTRPQRPGRPERPGPLGRPGGATVGRLPRQARPTVLHAALDGPAPVLEAAHDGYRVLPDRPVHHRTWRLSDERLELRDVVSGTPGARHRAEVVFHLAPGFRAHADGHRLFVESGSRAFLLDARGSGHWELRHGDVVVGVPASTVAGAGRRVHALAAAFVSTGSLPLSVLTVVEVLPEPGTRPAGRRAARVPAGAGRQAGQC